jgi:glycerophosphoryl diester phosphodiesterase
MNRCLMMIAYSICGVLGTIMMLSVATRADERAELETRKILVVAHRGASGYLPEHSEGAKVLAFAQGADIIEQDVVLSRDAVLVVSHDITLDDTTNVREIFPDRHRADGKYYYADFDWAELRNLALRERVLREQALREDQAHTRFPYTTDTRILRLADELKLIQGLNQVLGKNVGFHIELKSPAWHLKQFGFHIADKLVEVLNEHHVRPESNVCFVQCFEPNELIYLRNELQCRLPLVQLLGGRPLGLLKDSARAANPLEALKAELPEIAKYADGIGPGIGILVQSEASGIHSTGLVEAAHKHGLLVHPYTVRKDRLPIGAIRWMTCTTYC